MIIKRKLFSEEVSEEDRKKMKRVNTAKLMLAGADVGVLGSEIIRAVKTKNPPRPIVVIPAAAAVSIGVGAEMDQLTKLYKKYHPENPNPKWKEVNNWARKIRKEK